MAKEKSAPAANGWTELRRAIRENTLERLYVFHGEEKYLMEQALAALRQKLVPDGLDTFNLHTFSGKDLDVNALLDAMDALPMMGERSLVLVTDFDLFNANEEIRRRLEAAFADLPEYLCLVFVYDLLELKLGRSNLPKTVRKYGKILSFSPMAQTDLLDWIRRRFAAGEHSIDRTECEYLVFLCGNKMTGLLGEIDKISAYAKNRQITRRDIDAVANPVLDARVFDMTNAVGSRNFPQAMTTLSELFAMNEAPIAVLAALGKYLRQLYTARLVLESGRGTPAMMELWHMDKDWTAKKLLQLARGCSLTWCRRAVQLCCETDLAMKSTGQDGKTLLIQLMLELARG